MQLARSLLEKLAINEFEIDFRKDLLGLSQDDEQLLKLVGETLTEERLNRIVDLFYKKQLSVDEIAQLIGDSETLTRLHVSQRSYVETLFGGTYDVGYVGNRLQIGMVYKRIGVEPKLYLSGVSILRDILIDELTDLLPDEIAKSANRALGKLICFDVTLIIDTYIHGLQMDVELAATRVPSYARQLERKVEERTEKLKQLAMNDNLTGLFNQRAMRELIPGKISNCRVMDQNFALVFIDIDSLKGINDRQGHLAGDKVLTAFASALVKTARKDDIACRIGGDEFCVALSDCDTLQAEQFCRRLRQNLAEEGQNFTFSAGIAELAPDSELELDDLLRMADGMMYDRKRQGQQ